MIEKRLGKIDFVEFGSMKDYPLSRLKRSAVPVDLSCL